jgi:hypothetical protein
VKRFERVTLNPLAEDSTLQGLDLVGTDPSWGIYLMAHDYLPPKPEVQKVGGADVEGDFIVGTRYPNRTIPIRLRISEPPDPAGTNLATNPVGGLGVTGWSGTFGEPERVSIPDNAPIGTGIESALRPLLFGGGNNVYHEVAVTNGKTYRASLYVQKRAGSGKARIAVWNEAGTKKAEGAKLVEAIDQTAEGWIRLDVGFVADSTGTWRIGVIFETAGGTFYVTGVLLEESAELTSYFSGDSPGCDWTGARHGSTSTRPAPDGTRFARIYADVMAQIDRLKRERVGTYRRIAPGFLQTTFDLRSVEVTETPHDIAIAMKRAEIAISFEALPGGRTPEIQIGGNFDLAAGVPHLAFLAENVPGDMPGLGRLELEDRAAQMQLAVWWGLRQRYYDAAATAAPFYQAESRTPLGSAAKGAEAGASGGEVIWHKNLVPAYQGVFSTQASGGGAHLSHVGTYRVLSRMKRVPANAGAVSVKFVWSEGDFVNVEENDAVTFEVDENESQWQIVDLGTVTLSKAPTGSLQRWEGRVLASSTAVGDWLYVDWLLLVPADEGSGEARASTALTPPAALVAYDPYEQAAGALTGKAAALGGVYVLKTGGDTDDFNVDAANDWITRTAVSDTGEIMPGISGRAVGLPVNLSNVAMAYDLKTSNFNTNVQGFQLVRFVDANNFAWTRCGTEASGARMWVEFNVRAGGASTYATGAAWIPIQRTSWCTLTTLIVGEAYFVYLGLRDGEQVLLLSGSTSALAALGKGGAYIGDRCGDATATTRYFDNLEVWEPQIDAAIFASRRLELRHDRIRRQDSAGLVMGQVAYEGDYLLVPQAGPEKRVTQFVAKASRNPETDAGVGDALRGRLFVQPRYLVAPPS